MNRWAKLYSLLGAPVLPTRVQGDHKTEEQKLERALARFTELKMPRERDAVQAELDKMDGE